MSLVACLDAKTSLAEELLKLPWSIGNDGVVALRALSVVQCGGGSVLLFCRTAHGTDSFRQTYRLWVTGVFPSGGYDPRVPVTIPAGAVARAGSERYWRSPGGTPEGFLSTRFSGLLGVCDIAGAGTTRACFAPRPRRTRHCFLSQSCVGTLVARTNTGVGENVMVAGGIAFRAAYGTCGRTARLSKSISLGITRSNRHNDCRRHTRARGTLVPRAIRRP